MHWRRVQERVYSLYTTLPIICSRSHACANLVHPAKATQIQCLHSSAPAEETKDEPQSTTPLTRPPDRQDKDVIPNDLTATLAAHRASNLASIIRDVTATAASRPWKTVDLEGFRELEKVDEAPIETLDEGPISGQIKVKIRRGKHLKPLRSTNEGSVNAASDERLSVEGEKKKLKKPKRSPGEVPVKEAGDGKTINETTTKPFKIRKNFADIQVERAEWKPAEMLNRESQEASIRHKSAQTYKVGRYISPARFPDNRVVIPWVTPTISNMQDRRQR